MASGPAQIWAFLSSELSESAVFATSKTWLHFKDWFFSFYFRSISKSITLRSQSFLDNIHKFNLLYIPYILLIYSLCCRILLKSRTEIPLSSETEQWWFLNKNKFFGPDGNFAYHWFLKRVWHFLWNFMIFMAMFRRLLILSDTDSYIKEGKTHLPPTFLGCTTKHKSQYSKKGSLLLKIYGNRMLNMILCVPFLWSRREDFSNHFWI